MRMTGRSILAVCIVALGLGGRGIAQTTQADIATRLVGKPLLLRGFWADDKLRFHADGTPAKGYRTRPFTESAIDVTSVRLSGHDLVVEGQRVGLLFDREGTVTRLPLSRGGRGFGKSPEKMKIEIEGPSNGDLTKVLDAVFADKLADIAAALPDTWQPYARQYFLQETPPSGKKNFFAEAASTDEPALHIGGTIKPPKVLHMADPEFSEVARQQRISGSTSIYLQVAPSGEPEHICIARPVGLGLDEKALEAVSQYRFKPAMRDGVPVRVDIYVEVNFQIF